MGVREVLQLGNPLLREVCAPVSDPAAPEVAAVLADLRDTLAHWKMTTTYGRGITAPQIGVLQRIVFMNVDGHSPWPLVNPEIVAASDETQVVWDACLSFLSIFFQVRRHCWVTVRYQDSDGSWHELCAEGDLSELLQHEIDHLDGILALDRLTDVRTITARQEFERRHRGDSPYAR
ncbi:MAG TPA: peptide deformylase [Thermomicrobiales bacterium]|nr:peptide deformylase [Thermomicrobiales bacterium]